MKNKLNWNVYKQQDAIKHLKEYCDIDHIEPQWMDKGAFVACNQPFVWKNGSKTYSGKVH